MSPIIRAKCFTCRDIVCFSNFPVLIYYEIIKLAANHNRIDLVFDRYFENSLKEDTRTFRGSTGCTFPFDDDTELPDDMVGTFTTNNDNKNALNEYLAKKLIDLHQGSKLIITTFKNSVLCSSNTDIDTSEVGVHSCQSEEADQRLERHLLNCICGNKKYCLIFIRTIDTDVMILVVAYASEYQNMCSNTKVCLHGEFQQNVKYLCYCQISWKRYLPCSTFLLCSN